MGSTSRPHFFKIILPHTLDEKRLSLPPRFVTEYGDLFPTTLLLELPNGRKWKMGLMRNNGGAWLQNGWQEFAEYCGLAVGHFLVFKFDGDSSFNVFILDNSAFEISYPCNHEREIFREFENDDDSVEILDNFDDDLSRRRVRFKCAGMAGSFKGSKRFEALQIASSFECRNPFFKVLIQPSYTKQGMYIPIVFARRYFCNKHGDCNFSTEDGRRTWLASYQQVGLKSRVRILSGLAKFVEDNYLKVGDVCVFELKKVKELSFEVSIFPAKKDRDLLISRGEEDGSLYCKKGRRRQTDQKYGLKYGNLLPFHCSVSLYSCISTPNGCN